MSDSDLRPPSLRIEAVLGIAAEFASEYDFDFDTVKRQSRAFSYTKKRLQKIWEKFILRQQKSRLAQAEFRAIRIAGRTPDHPERFSPPSTIYVRLGQLWVSFAPVKN
jgi:hypothetical protein